MKKNTFFFMAILFAFAGCRKDIQPVDERLSASVSQQDATSARPNIILIVGDDIGYEVPTCDGGQSYLTPNLDKLAKQGVRLTQCHGSPLCSPSRFMLFTGKYNFRNYTKWGIMDLGQKTIANMFRDAGYKTLIAGKWQFDGGDNSIRTLGFDNYLVWEPYTGQDEMTDGSRYKNPMLYQNGAFLPTGQTQGKYGDDMFTSYILQFLDTNYNKPDPFFVYYPMALGHKPFCPTPDDPEFAGWNPDLGISDSTFFPSMVKYMDKKIGLILNRVNTLGIANNTIILYVGDNGTSGEIYSMFQGTLIRGGKSHPTEYGTHVPMIAWAPNRFPAGTVNNNLVDFTDFLPTMATLANIAKPVSYGILDGTDFAAQLYGQPGTPRSQIFCHYDPHPGHSKISRWVQNTQYKKYDTLTTTSQKNKFYNFLLDPNEDNPIASTARTSQEKTLCKSFDAILQTMHN